MEKRIEVKTYIIKKFCECGGEMLPNGCVLTTYPPMYSHDCDKCGKRACYDNEYPKMEYEEIE